jgi:ribose/xylose/arabinose/galactoside ABC-type transport system permease subunit
MSAGNLSNLVLGGMPLYILALGQTAVLIAGGIDLSMASVMALASVAGALIMSGDGGLLSGHPLAIWAGVLAILAVGAAVGSLNGLAVQRFRMPPFIVTLSSMTFFSGLAVWVTNSKPIGRLPAVFNALGGNLTPLLIIGVMLSAGMFLLLRRSIWGRWLYATGHNSRTARISGVPVGRVIVSAYAVSGILSALAGMLLTGQLETAEPVLGQRMLLDIVAASVIGGASLFGGRGSIYSALLGALLIKLVDISLNLNDLSHFAIMMVKGGIIFLAAMADFWRNRS